MIYAIGDSFTEGGELPGQYWGVPGKGAWPEVLESLVGQKIINKGRSATGNTRIVKRAIDAVLNDATGIVICWTSHLRIEMIDSDGIYDTWPAADLICIAKDPKMRYRSELQKYMLEHQTTHSCLLYKYKNFLRQIILVQNLCKNYQVDCSMLVAYGAKQDAQDFHNDNSVQNLLKAIDLNMFVNNTIQESTQDWTLGIEKMPKGHPSITGHKIIAEQIWNHICNNWRRIT